MVINQPVLKFRSVVLRFSPRTLLTPLKHLKFSVWVRDIMKLILIDPTLEWTSNLV